MAKELRHAEKAEENKSLEMQVCSTVDDIDRTSINGKAAEIFLNRISVKDIAYSLYAMDRDLFLRVIPWQCLGSVWSRRGSGSDIHTVKSTVRQFNKVVYLVLSTVLSPCLSMNQRSGIVQKWIQVAQECMKLKNYSSLRAIVSGRGSS